MLVNYKTARGRMDKVFAVLLATFVFPRDLILTALLMSLSRQALYENWPCAIRALSAEAQLCGLRSVADRVSEMLGRSGHWATFRLDGGGHWQ